MALTNNIGVELITTDAPGTMHREAATCPSCNAKSITIHSTITTLLGGTPDPNHFDRDCECNKCHLRFGWHHKYNRGLTYHWYTINSVTVKGFPACCPSNYKIVCPKCEADADLFYNQFGKDRPQSITYSWNTPRENLPKLICECPDCGYRQGVIK